MYLSTRIKKLAVKVAVISALGACGTESALAQESKESGSIPVLLTYIANYTYYTLKAINNFPTYLNTITTLALSWLSPDNSDTTANLQYDFSKLTNQTIQNSKTQLTMQKQLAQEYLGPGVTAKMLPFANDITYQSVLGTPYFPNQKEDSSKPAYNYIKNAAGINLSHALPDEQWKGSDANKGRYKTYFQTVSAIQSYNGYILSRLYLDNAKESKLNDQQQKLVQQASSSDWFVQVASENLGIVLRQILLYNSQIYVVLSQLLETQKQQLAAQAMTNTLLVVRNQKDEETLLSNAIGG